ncbi:GNAT family N-acetyltransferase [Planococcus sp. N064]|uniref:GNAT family N-acetyltransferase n=1 Tax=Planococcus liqunii TaxID=3058394 RepID=A0ABT8MNU6_9BACL|nr:GNAT family N-acetyltransferase [Planococcus sp. N064]MDN7226424.1 GNAT family N-acetyltransferase [Planococcus sp. N064]
MKDLYFAQTYGRLYENIEGGKCEVYDFHHSAGTIRHVFIKREIPITLNGISYFDIVTPYAYGGPIILCYEENRKRELINEFQKAFKYYCNFNNIICEIVRFHPGISNADDFTGIFDMHYIGDTLGTNLSVCTEPLQEEFSDACKKVIFDALEKGVDYRIAAGPYNPRYFKDVFFSIAEYKKEINYKLFNKDYFSSCFEISRKNTIIVEAIYEGSTIGISVNLLFNNILQPQISATQHGFNHLSPKHILQYGLANWGKQNGVGIIHNGGGNTIGEEDDLYLFKKQFGSLSFKYFVGKKVWNKEIYAKLCNAVGVGIDAEYFPAYRIREQMIVEEEESVKK